MYNNQLAITQLRQISNEIVTLGYIINSVYLDMDTQAPEGSMEDKGSQLEYLEIKLNSLQKDPKVLELINQLEEAELDPEDKALCRIMRKKYKTANSLSDEYLAKKANLDVKSSKSWKEARSQNDFAIFAPDLQAQVDLAREKAELLGYVGHPYNALLEGYLPDSSVEMYDRIFEPLKIFLSQTIPQIKTKQSREGVKELKIKGQPKDKQIQFCHYLLELLGYDLNRGKLIETAHPYTIELSPNDVRISNRYSPDSLEYISCLTHENGHGQYGLGIDPNYSLTQVGEGLSYGFHESQSRIYEVMMGLSQEFLILILPKLKELMPEQFETVSEQSWLNHHLYVGDSKIRVDCDPISYNLHIIIRYELEKKLIEGSLDVKDLPAEWNRLYEVYLGLKIENDSEGCLQDLHWSDGTFGYFPTYTYGNLLAAQLWQSFVTANPNWSQQVASGDLITFQKWLNQNVHQYGSLYPEKELIRHVTGEDLNPQHFQDWVRERYL
jgi:carboxypeptidase Taq